jgi:hypothetical protein
MGKHAKAKKWPKGSADIVDTGIAIAEIAAGYKALQGAQQLKGDEDAVIEAADMWRKAGEEMLHAEKPLGESWRRLTADWEGGAYDAFRWHMTANAKVAEDNSTALFNASNALLDLAVKVTDAYNRSVDLVIFAAERIEPAMGGIGLTSNDDPDKPTISAAVTDFIKAYYNVESALRTSITEEKVGLAKVAIEVSKLKEPSEFPPNATDPGKWEWR